MRFRVQAGLKMTLRQIYWGTMSLLGKLLMSGTDRSNSMAGVSGERY